MTAQEFFSKLPERVDPAKTAGMNNKYVFDVEGVGTFTVEGNQLVLQDMWLGSPQDAVKPANCGHRFER